MVDRSAPRDAAIEDEARRRLIFALDFPDLEQARKGAAQVRSSVGIVKVGLELFVRAGPPAVRMAHELGLDVFLDLKLHDIPATVERAVARAADLGARLLTVHAAGGAAMLERAVARSADAGLTVVAVTVLTSLDGRDLAAQGLAPDPAAHALRLAALAWSVGVRSFVCSPAEAGSLRAALGPDAEIITPGVRPRGAASQDQKRVATPGTAIAAGADRIVVGRPIRDAADPDAAARAIAHEIAVALRARRSS